MFTPKIALLPLPHLPSSLKFPNKSQQIDTYLCPPFSLSCPRSRWTERPLINQAKLEPSASTDSLPCSADEIASVDPPRKKKKSKTNHTIHNSLRTPAPFLSHTKYRKHTSLERLSWISDWLIWGSRVCLRNTHGHIQPGKGAEGEWGRGGEEESRFENTNFFGAKQTEA